MHEIDRTERMQRIRVGLTGLAVVLLIVLLATIVYSYFNRDTPPINASEVNRVAEEPLSDLGVVPGAPDNKVEPVGNAMP
jgi:hypothetical protein